MKEARTERIRRTMARLSEEDETFIQRCCLDAQSCEQVAQETGLPEEDVRLGYRRARMRLLRLLGELPEGFTSGAADDPDQ